MCLQIEIDTPLRIIPVLNRNKVSATSSGERGGLEERGTADWKLC